VTMPNFLVIGAMKAGTTSLYYYLREHPQIYLNPTLKEMRFFCYEGQTLDFKGPGDQEEYRNAITSIDDYRAFFRGVAHQKAIGDISVEYLYVPRTVEHIRTYVPQAKLVAILRHPADRAYSNFLHCVREGTEPCADFGEALRREPARIRQNWAPGWHYIQVGFYYGQLKRYFDAFDRDQIRIYLYDDFQMNPASVAQDIFRFLEVDDSFVPDMSLRYNVSGIPRSRTLHMLLGSRCHPIKTVLRPFVPSRWRLTIRERVRHMNLHPPPPLYPALRRQLVEVYREDILNLQDLLGRDLTHWLQVKEDKPKGNFG
jgi:Sulfotransferase family